MADCKFLLTPAEKFKKSISSFFISPKFFPNFTSKGLHNETDTMTSPTSILDTKPFPCFKNPFWFETTTPTATTPAIEHKRYWNRIDSKGVGLGIVDALFDDKSGEFKSKPESRRVVFGSQLKVQIPPLAPPSESLKSSSNFEIKANNSQVGSIDTSNSARVFKGCLSVSEMELSEDYTRVILHGPNPRTIHIFDNCIVDSSYFDHGFPGSANPDQTIYPSDSFLSFCFYCKKYIGLGKDIFMYLGERAFCSRKCRYQGILLEGDMESLDVAQVDEEEEAEDWACMNSMILIM